MRVRFFLLKAQLITDISSAVFIVLISYWRYVHRVHDYETKNFHYQGCDLCLSLGLSIGHQYVYCNFV